MKICKKCNIEKSLNDFHNLKTSKDSKYSICKNCKKEYDIEYRKKIGNKYYTKDKAKDKYRKNPSRILLNSIRFRSKKK